MDNSLFTIHIPVWAFLVVGVVFIVGVISIWKALKKPMD